MSAAPLRLLTWLLLALAALLGGVLAYRTYAPGTLHGSSLDPVRTLPPVTLTRDDGRAVTLSGPQPVTRLVFFGFTRCPDTCPATLGVLARAWETLSPRQQQGLEISLVTVDPATDRPAVLRHYLNRFQNSFRGYTGSAAQLQAADQAFYVYAQLGQAPSDVMHSDQVALINRQGQFVRVYNNLSVAAGDLTADLPRLIGE
jgi:protein SCO1